VKGTKQRSIGEEHIEAEKEESMTRKCATAENWGGRGLGSKKRLGEKRGDDRRFRMLDGSKRGREHNPNRKPKMRGLDAA